MQPADMGSSSSRAITSEYFFVKGIKLTFGLELCFLLCTVSAAVPSSLLTVELDPEDSAADTVDAEFAEVDCGVGDAC
jgi:hypothetical protein